MERWPPLCLACFCLLSPLPLSIAFGSIQSPRPLATQLTCDMADIMFAHVEGGPSECFFSRKKIWGLQMCLRCQSVDGKVVVKKSWLCHLCFTVGRVEDRDYICVCCES